MKVNKFMTIRMLLVLLVTISITSCSKNSGSNGGSKGTGWKINDKKGGFQYASKFKKQETGPGLVLVEGGTFTMGRVQDDPMRDWDNTAKQQHVMSFYMDETEVTNLMYMEYLDWMKRVFPPSDDKYKNIYEGACPDTLVWRNRLGQSETMVKAYLRHPAWAEYPVVGVNWVQATEFSKWRTDRVNESILEREGYLKKDAKVLDVNAESTFNTETYIIAPSKTYGGNEKIVFKGPKNSKAANKGGVKGSDGVVKPATNVYAQRTSGIILPEYRLPTEAEWEYAAASDLGKREYNNLKGQKKYPWSGSYTRSDKRQIKGDQLANFKQGKGDYGGLAGWSDDGADITNKVKSYPPNDFGLYDMAGNVSEWVADVYRPIVDDEANDFNYYRGNEYTKNKLDANGKDVELVTSATQEFKTLPNGKQIAVSFPGQIAQVPVDNKETYLRQNFDKSDERDYRDGDKQSTRGYNSPSNNDPMYDHPEHNKIAPLTFDTSNTRTSLVSNETRVYKGGSWRDRAYWLDPAQRRYFPQDMATDYIGFRCAMSRVGAKSDIKKSARNKVRK